MYIIVDKRLKCSHHGRVKGAIHLFVENGDINGPRNTWLICIHCARKLDADPKFRASKRGAFEAYQKEVAAYMEEQRS
jgi:hypothetical protein